MQTCPVFITCELSEIYHKKINIKLIAAKPVELVSKSSASVIRLCDNPLLRVVHQSFHMPQRALNVPLELLVNSTNFLLCAASLSAVAAVSPGAKPKFVAFFRMLLTVLRDMPNVCAICLLLTPKLHLYNLIRIRGLILTTIIIVINLTTITYFLTFWWVN